MKSAGFAASLPYLFFGIAMNVLGPIADWMISNKYLTVGKLRKFFTALGMILQALLLIITAYTSNPTTCVILITLAVSVGAFVCPGKITV